MSFTKTITPAFEFDGRRKLLTGFDGVLTDESGIALHSMEYSTYGQAETALNALTYELLMDLVERGLTDTVPGPIDPLPDDGPGDPIPGDEDYEYPRSAPPILMPEGDWIDVEGMRVVAPRDYYISKAVAETSQIPLLVDVHTVLSQCLSNAPAKAMVPELRRLLARVESELSTERVPSPRRASTSMLSKIRQGF